MYSRHIYMSLCFLCLLSYEIVLLSVNARPMDNVVKPELEEEDSENQDSKLTSEDEEYVLSEKKLKPVDHLEGVKMEQDGMLNKDFHREVFLGKHEEIEDDSTEIAESKLMDIIMKVDQNNDGLLTVQELEDWIFEKVREHFDEAVQENAKIFKHMDPDGDGLVDWKEYYIHFLLAKGYPADKAKQHVVDYDVVDMQVKEKDQLIKYKFRWTDADKPPMDNKLSQSEFLAFRHPEQSSEALEEMMNAIFGSLDENDDDRLTEVEFIALAIGDVEDEEQRKMDKEWQEERRSEFNKAIDEDHDGIVTRQELSKYLDPRNSRHARAEAESLISIMDKNKDGQLNMDEIMENKDMFLNSKIINVGRILHDEF